MNLMEEVILTERLFNSNIYWQGANNYCIPPKAVIFEPMPSTNLTFYAFCNSRQLRKEQQCASEQGTSGRRKSTRGTRRLITAGFLMKQSHPVNVKSHISFCREVGDLGKERERGFWSSFLSLRLLRSPQRPQISYVLEKDQNFHEIKPKPPIK